MYNLFNYLDYQNTSNGPCHISNSTQDANLNDTTDLNDNPSNFRNTGPEIKLRTTCSTGSPHATRPTQTTHQDKQKPSEPAQQLQNFILGDSILRNIEPLILNGELTNLNTVVNCIPGAKISDISKRISDVAKHTKALTT